MLLILLKNALSPCSLLIMIGAIDRHHWPGRQRTGVEVEVAGDQAWVRGQWAYLAGRDHPKSLI